MENLAEFLTTLSVSWYTVRLRRRIVKEEISLKRTNFPAFLHFLSLRVANTKVTKDATRFELERIRIAASRPNIKGRPGVEVSVKVEQSMLEMRVVQIIGWNRALARPATPLRRRGTRETNNPFCGGPRESFSVAESDSVSCIAWRTIDGRNPAALLFSLPWRISSLPF